MWRDIRRAALVACTLACSAPAQAGDEAGLVLAQGEGADKVQALCAICHSLDYIHMNSPFQDTTGWDKTVTKMVKVMGAPITQEDSAVIVAYLARHYGKETTR